MAHISFSRCRSQRDCPYVRHVISHDADAGTLRFDGYFHDVDGEGKTCIPCEAHMTGVGVVRILEKVVGPSTNAYGGESGHMAVERIHAAAASSAPFEPIPAPEPASEREVELRTQEREKLGAEREAAKELPGYDSDDYIDICFFSSNIIDLRYERVKNKSSREGV